MFKLSLPDREFYSKEDSWFSGPIFELKLVFVPDFSGQTLSEFLVQEFNLITWVCEFDPTPLRTIVYLDEGFSFGLRHSFYTTRKEPRYFVYRIGIRPSQLIRLVKYYPDISDVELPHDWDSANFEKMDKVAFARIIGFFTHVAHKVYEYFPLKFATIGDEGKAWVFPGKQTHKEGLYLDRDFEYVFPVKGSKLSPESDKLFIYKPFSEINV